MQLVVPAAQAVRYLTCHCLCPESAQNELNTITDLGKKKKKKKKKLKD